MDYKGVPDFREHLEQWSDDIQLFRQNWLMGEGQFLTFAKDLGLPVSGIITGDPSNFFSRGWLYSDETEWDGKPRFHPFRVYPLHRIWRDATFGSRERSRSTLTLL